MSMPSVSGSMPSVSGSISPPSPKLLANFQESLCLCVYLPVAGTHQSLHLFLSACPLFLALSLHPLLNSWQTFYKVLCILTCCGNSSKSTPFSMSMPSVSCSISPGSPKLLANFLQSSVYTDLLWELIKVYTIFHEHALCFLLYLSRLS